MTGRDELQRAANEARQALHRAELALLEHDRADAEADLEQAFAECTCDPEARRYDESCWVADARDRIARINEAIERKRSFL